MATRQKGRLNLSWLKPPPMPADGNMALADHLRELRYRLVVAVLAIVVVAILCAFFYNQLFQVLLQPINLAVEELHRARPEQTVSVITTEVASPVTLALKVCGYSGLILSSPVWLYQLWAFIAPGLLAKEKKWAMIFLGSAIPLFLAGVAVGYIVMPKGIAVMLSFTPANQEISNLVDLPYFLNFLLRLMLIFGLAFLLPVVLVVLNLAGVVSGEQLGKARSYAILACFIFAAVATPSTDPFSMLVLAVPMAVLYVVAEIIARVHDRTRKKKDELDLDDDEIELRAE